MDFLSQALQLILSLSILVVLHEAGHFFPARWFKTRVEKFYLFFDPWFSLFKVKKGDTEYGIGWLPLGGYVKISGMIDESMDKEQMAKPPESWEFRAKPAWQRLIIMLGGVTVNLILGFLIYIMVMGVWGEVNIPMANVKNGYAVDSLLIDCGMESGDEILYFNDHFIPDDAGSLTLGFITNKFNTVTVERDETQLTIDLGEDFGQRMLDNGVKLPASPRVETYIKEITEDENAEKAGLLEEDKIVSVNGVQTPFFDQMREELKKHKKSTVTLGIIREGALIEKSCEVTKNATLGFSRKTAYDLFQPDTLRYGFLPSFGAGIRLGKEKLTSYVYTIRYLFSASGVKQMGGFGAIGGMFNPDWDWKGFWIATAFLSLILAFMNILPIPALDGGHVMFLIYEIIRGKAPPQKFMEIAQMIGMLLLLTLVLYANGNDLWKALQGWFD